MIVASNNALAWCNLRLRLILPGLRAIGESGGDSRDMTLWSPKSVLVESFNGTRSTLTSSAFEVAVRTS